MLTGLPELLRNDALLWYRNHRASWTHWDDFIRAFREQYLPRRYRAQLVRELQHRRRLEGEPYAKYATAVLTLMRRAGRLEVDEQVEQLYEGLLPEYKLHVRRDDVRTLAELGSRTAEFKAITASGSTLRPPERPRHPTLAAAYNRRECCWRCKERGHTRTNCRRPARKFCSECGKDGILTRECHPRPGNATRAGVYQAEPRSLTESE
ncbi:activity-regulated cytoskeleton associated protein 1-like [Odontomachus brunneus]|uniref:activity-regulated cytoskeleton associated protein 1-like n=1 Tax=Odontomachus brunneus TaxID=486640 RepID=UPI0013F20ADD|nr:activity-regulated cytoskeleton associated protein 1-like [Odontomachus brunneus]